MSYKEELVKELEDYGLTKGQIDRVLDVFRIVYISQGNLFNEGLSLSPYTSSKIYRRSNGKEIFEAKKEIQMLYGIGMIVEPNIYFSKCTKRAEKIGHELVEECIQRNKNDLILFFDRYSNKFVGYVLHVLERSTKDRRANLRSEPEILRGYLICQDPKSYPLSENPIDKLTEKIKEFCEGLSTFNLTELCMVAYSENGSGYDTFYYIFPPEIINFIKNFDETIKLEREDYTSRKILYEYSDIGTEHTHYLTYFGSSSRNNIPIRGEFVEILSENEVSEIKIQNIIDESHGYGLTSKYSMKNDKAPFFVLNKDDFKKILATKIPDPIIYRRSKASKKWWEFWR